MAAAMLPIFQFFTDTGAPLAAGIITPKTAGGAALQTYSDRDLTTNHPDQAGTGNITLSAAGRLSAPIWVGQEAQFTIKATALGATLHSITDFNTQDVASASAWGNKTSLVQEVSANHTLAVGDNGKLFIATGTPTFTTGVAAASMGAIAFSVKISNAGTGVVTFDPISTEQIQTQVNAAATSLSILPGETWEIRCDGAKYWGLRNEYAPRCRFRATKDNAQTLAFGAATTITGWDEKLDVGGNFASNTFTAPVAGIYLLGATCSIDNIADTIPAYIALNFSTAESRIGTRQTSSFIQDLNLEVISMVSLAASEICQVEVFHNDSADRDTLATSTYHSFWGVRIA